LQSSLQCKIAWCYAWEISFFRKGFERSLSCLIMYIFWFSVGI
jgi:hypothetical protein